MMPYSQRLRRAWPILIQVARERRTISYSELAGLAGPPFTPRAVHRQLLNPLAASCRRFGLPDLASLVVRKGAGIPGGGWFDAADPGDPLEVWARAVRRCHAHAWTDGPHPLLLAEVEDE
jgi:hypothetical protein